MKLPQLIVAIAVLPMAGCFPYATTYTHIDVPGATYKRTICRDFGPPDIAQYRVNDIEFELSLNPGYYRWKGAHWMVRAAPNVQLVMPEMFATFDKEDGTRESLPLDMRWTMRDEDGRLTSVDYQGMVAIYRFALRRPALISSGEIRLPTMHANGVAVVSPPVKVERRPFAGFLPLNC